MTEFMHQDRLRQLAHVMEQPNLPSQGLIPRLQWVIDPDTRRPVSRWVVEPCSEW